MTTTLILLLPFSTTYILLITQPLPIAIHFHTKALRPVLSDPIEIKQALSVRKDVLEHYNGSPLFKNYQIYYFRK